MQCVLGIAGKVVLSEANGWWGWDRRSGYTDESLWACYVGGWVVGQHWRQQTPDVLVGSSEDGFAWSQNSLIFPKIGMLKR